MTLQRILDPGLVFTDRGRLEPPQMILPPAPMRLFSGAAVEAAVTSEYGHFALWNPAASGVRLICPYVHVTTGTSTASAWRMGPTTTELTNSSADVGSTSSDGPTPVGQVRSDTYASASAQMATGGAGGLHKATIPGNDGADLMSSPYDCWTIAPGYGLLVVTINSNLQAMASFRWWEIEE